MRDYEYLFATTLQQRLKTKIKGKIFCKVTYNDELYVSIRNENSGIECELREGGFSEKILNGYSTQYAEYEIIKKYKIYLNDRFFYND